MGPPVKQVFSVSRWKKAVERAQFAFGMFSLGIAVGFRNPLMEFTDRTRREFGSFNAGTSEQTLVAPSGVRDRANGKLADESRYRPIVEVYPIPGQFWRLPVRL